MVRHPMQCRIRENAASEKTSALSMRRKDNLSGYDNLPKKSLTLGLSARLRLIPENRINAAPTHASGRFGGTPVRWGQFAREHCVWNCLLLQSKTV